MSLLSTSRRISATFVSRQRRHLHLESKTVLFQSHMYNVSFVRLKLSDRSSRTTVRSLLNKHSLNANHPAVYRPIYNLSVCSKVLVKVVDARFADHIVQYNPLPALQSVYRPYHSSETAVVCILKDMIGGRRSDTSALRCSLTYFPHSTPSNTK